MRCSPAPVAVSRWYARQLRRLASNGIHVRIMPCTGSARCALVSSLQSIIQRHKGNRRRIVTVASEYQGNPITLLVTGTVSGDTMNLKIQTEDGAWGTDAVVKRGS